MTVSGCGGSPGREHSYDPRASRAFSEVRMEQTVIGIRRSGPLGRWAGHG